MDAAVATAGVLVVVLLIMLVDIARIITLLL